jgi:hypothetical protein
MVNGTFKLFLNPLDFLVEAIEPFAQLFNRQRIEILTREQRQRIGWRARQKIVNVHVEKC